jgi:hypothetical protein
MSVYETLSLTHILRAFENGVLRTILRSKRHKVVGGWRRLHNEEPHKLYASQNITRVIKSRGWGGRGM